MQSHELKGMAQVNTVLTSSNTAVMEKFTQMTMTNNSMHAKLKMIAAAPMNQERSKSKYHGCSCGRNYTPRRKTLSSNKNRPSISGLLQEETGWKQERVKMAVRGGN